MESVHEEWRPVPGFEEQYEVSDQGRVRSLDRLVRWQTRWGTIGRRQKTGQTLKPIEHHTGYLIVNFGTKHHVRIHQIVAWAFIGPQGNKVVNHINGNKQDNRPENLEYITNSDNVKHAYRTGLLDNRGEKNGRHRSRRTASVK